MRARCGLWLKQAILRQVDIDFCSHDELPASPAAHPSDEGMALGDVAAADWLWPNGFAFFGCQHIADNLTKNTPVNLKHSDTVFGELKMVSKLCRERYRATCLRGAFFEAQEADDAN